MKNIIKNLKFILDYLKAFARWFVFSVIIGIVGGVVGSLFHLCIDYGTEMREEKAFSSEKELIMQINIDKNTAIERNKNIKWQDFGLNLQ